MYVCGGGGVGEEDFRDEVMVVEGTGMLWSYQESERVLVEFELVSYLQDEHAH